MIFFWCPACEKPSKLASGIKCNACSRQTNANLEKCDVFYDETVKELVHLWKNENHKEFDMARADMRARNLVANYVWRICRHCKTVSTLHYLDDFRYMIF